MRRASKRRRADERQHEPQPQPQQRLSIITWNVDGLRALLRSPDGEAALRKLLIAEPLVLCLLEHKLQGDGAHSDSLKAWQKLEAIASEFGYTSRWGPSDTDAENDLWGEYNPLRLGETEMEVLRCALARCRKKSVV